MTDEHARLSPSSSHRWLVCPGSVQANVDKPLTQNIHALLGTSAHALLELCLRLAAEPNDFIGNVIQQGHFAVDQEMADSVGYALDYVRMYTADRPNAKVRIEHRVDMDTQLGLSGDDSLCWGTSDIIIDDFPSECCVIDYKHGVGIPVSVKNNSQLKLYAAGQRAAAGRYRRYRIVVIQPRLRGRKPVQESTFTDKELTAWLDKTVAPVIPIALGDKAPRFAGDHCQYCHADGKCPEQYKTVQRLAAEEFKTDPKGLTPADIGKTLDAIKLVERMAKSISEHAIALVHAGVEVPGWVAGFTAQRRLWVDEETALVRMQELGIDKRDRYKIEVISPTQTEEYLKKAGKWPKRKRGSAEEDFADPIKDLVGYSEANPTIKRAKE